MDALVNKLLLEYTSKVTDPNERLVLQEAIKYIDEHPQEPSGLIKSLRENLPFERKFIIKVVREASKYKNERVKIYNISEGIN